MPVAKDTGVDRIGESKTSARSKSLTPVDDYQ